MPPHKKPSAKGKSQDKAAATAAKGSLGDTPEFPVAHPRGRGRVLPRTLEDVDKEVGDVFSKDAGVVDSPIAAAASTLVYQLAYGDGSASNNDQTRRWTIARAIRITASPKDSFFPTTRMFSGLSPILTTSFLACSPRINPAPRTTF